MCASSAIEPSALIAGEGAGAEGFPVLVEVVDRFDALRRQFDEGLGSHWFGGGA
jgi:hypothetical protein